jgi:hypothetical protein
MYGPALLVTHDCAMDKPNRDGSPRIRNIHFLPALALSLEDPNRQSLLRKEAVAPFEAFYVGDVPSLGEVYCVLSEQFSVPSAYFSPALKEFPSDGGEESAAKYLVAKRNGDRFGRVEPNRLALLHDKISAYWTRRAQEETRR